ncbi:hypothetical protein Hamer_G017391, partial [Homarus americanus]
GMFVYTSRKGGKIKLLKTKLKQTNSSAKAMETSVETILPPAPSPFSSCGIPAPAPPTSLHDARPALSPIHFEVSSSPQSPTSSTASFTFSPVTPSSSSSVSSTCFTISSSSLSSPSSTCGVSQTTSTHSFPVTIAITSSSSEKGRDGQQCHTGSSRAQEEEAGGPPSDCDSDVVDLMKVMKRKEAPPDADLLHEDLSTTEDDDDDDFMVHFAHTGRKTGRSWWYSLGTVRDRYHQEILGKRQ